MNKFSFLNKFFYKSRIGLRKATELHTSLIFIVIFDISPFSPLFLQIFTNLTNLGDIQMFNVGW